MACVSTTWRILPIASMSVVTSALPAKVERFECTAFLALDQGLGLTQSEAVIRSTPHAHRCLGHCHTDAAM